MCTTRAPDRRRSSSSPTPSSLNACGLDCRCRADTASAFAGGRVPGELTTVEALRECARVLRPGGVWLANLTDEPPRRYVAAVAAAAVQAGMAHQVWLATHDVRKGRRFGNTVVAASSRPIDEAHVRRAAARSPHPTGVLDQADLNRRIRGIAPATDAAPLASPMPPDPRRWRRS